MWCPWQIFPTKVTFLLEYFDPVNYTCLVLVLYVLPLAFHLPKDTATMITNLHTKFQVVPISHLPCMHDRSFSFFKWIIINNNLDIYWICTKLGMGICLICCLSVPNFKVIKYGFLDLLQFWKVCEINNQSPWIS